MFAGKSLLALANNIKVLASNRSGEPKQGATVSNTNEWKKILVRSDGKVLKVLIYSMKKKWSKIGENRYYAKELLKVPVLINRSQIEVNSIVYKRTIN